MGSNWICDSGRGHHGTILASMAEALQALQGQQRRGAASKRNRDAPHFCCRRAGRSEFVIVPVALSNETTSAAMSGGNASLHTIGCILFNNENHTPPLPSAAASWYAIYWGMSGTNSRTWVGRAPRRWIREQISLIVDLTSFPNTIDFTPVFKSLLRGVKNPFAAGR